MPNVISFTETYLFQENGKKIFPYLCTFLSTEFYSCCLTDGHIEAKFTRLFHSGGPAFSATKKASQ